MNPILILNNLGFNIDVSDDGSGGPAGVNQLVIQNTSLRDSIINNIEKDYGKTILKMSLPSEYYVRYKNGTFSSMLKGSGGILGHQGHEEISIANIVDNILHEVSYSYTNAILKQVQSFSDQLLNSISEMNTVAINIITEQFEQEKIDEIEAIKDFIEEIFNNISDIARSNQRSGAYINQIVSMRRQAIKVYNHFIKKIHTHANTHSVVNPTGYVYPYNPALIANDYFWCRQATSCYTLCAIFEHILSGSIDEKSIKTVTVQVENFLKKFTDADNRLKNCLLTRSKDYDQWNLWRGLYQDAYGSNESSHIRWFVETCMSNPQFETELIQSTFEKSRKFLDDIAIL
ncbi:hypothetical protein LJC47_00300 [Desulfosarcina sp. OttesenSCG-928-B08]|nr:hypothetical protein [Desulfosarcina sp. OttesenSCG-928-B08]